MAVRGEDDVCSVDGGNALTHLGKHAAVFLGGGVANSVWHVNGGGSSFNCDADHLDKEVSVGAGGIFRRELDILDVGAGETNGFGGEVESFLTADLELVLEMQIAGGEEDMDAAAVGELQGASSHFDVFGLRAGKGSDARLADGLGDGGDGREVALGGHGEAGLDDVHAQVFEGMGHGELFLRGHAAAGRLFAIA